MRFLRQLATHPPGHEYETQVHGDYIRWLMRWQRLGLDFDVGEALPPWRRPLGPDEFFWQGRVPLDLEI